jgi:hypothetical protein
MAGLLGDIFSAGNIAKRKLTDLLGNPILSAQQMLGNLNDRARVLNQMTSAAAQEGMQYGPASQQLAGLLSEAYNPVGMTKNVEYRGSHTAPNAQVYGATLDDLTKIMPADVYESKGKQLYGIGNPIIDSQWRIAALKAKGKPDAEIEIYRAAPKGVKEINSGDWVTTSPEYAKWHGENVLDGEYEIIKQKVKAKTLSTEGYPYEFGYNP